MAQQEAEQQIEGEKDIVQRLNEPIPSRDRQVQDFCWLIAYCLFLLCAVSGITSAVIVGDIGRLSRATGQNYTCGYPGQNPQNYSYAYFFKPTMDITQAVCVEKCPEVVDGQLEPLSCFDQFKCNYSVDLTTSNPTSLKTRFLGYQTIVSMNRFCMPTDRMKEKMQGTNLEGNIYTSTYQPTFFNLFLDIANNYTVLIVTPLIVVLVALVMRLLLRFCEHAKFLWIGYILFFFIYLGGGLILFMYAGAFGENRTYLNLLSSQTRSIYLIFALLIIFFILVQVVSLIGACRSSFRDSYFNVHLILAPETKSVQIQPEEEFQEGEMVDTNYCCDGTFCLSICMTILLLGLWAIFLFAVTFLGSGMELEDPNTDAFFEKQKLFLQPDFSNENQNPVKYAMIIILLFWTLWTHVSLTSLSRLLICYRLCINHFYGNKKIKIRGDEGIKRTTLRYHMGSVIIGSIISTLLSPFQHVLWSFGYKEQGVGQNPSNLKNCMKWISNKLRFLSLTSFTCIALYGTNFWQSSKASHRILWRNVEAKFSQVQARKLVLGVWKWNIAGMLLIALGLAYNSSTLSINTREPIYLFIIVIIISLGILEIWMQGYEIKAQANTICLAAQTPENRQPALGREPQQMHMEDIQMEKMK